jgi:hypothetical protein
MRAPENSRVGVMGTLYAWMRRAFSFSASEYPMRRPAKTGQDPIDIPAGLQPAFGEHPARPAGDVCKLRE